MTQTHPMTLISMVHLTWKRQVQARIADQGISLKHSSVLSELLRSDFLNPSQIAELLFCDRPTATVAIDTMVRHGWVRREPDPDNGKKIRVVITSAGKKKQAEVQASFHDVPGPDPLACLDAAEQKMLGELLERIRDHLGTLASKEDG